MGMGGGGGTTKWENRWSETFCAPPSRQGKSFRAPLPLLKDFYVRPPSVGLWLKVQAFVEKLPQNFVCPPPPFSIMSMAIHFCPHFFVGVKLHLPPPPSRFVAPSPPPPRYYWPLSKWVPTILCGGSMQTGWYILKESCVCMCQYIIIIWWKATDVMGYGSEVAFESGKLNYLIKFNNQQSTRPVASTFSLPRPLLHPRPFIRAGVD